MSPQDALQQIRNLISHDRGGRRDDAKIAEVCRLLSYMPADLTIYARGKCKAPRLEDGGDAGRASPQKIGSQESGSVLS